jgi:hypothetical protein
MGDSTMKAYLPEEKVIFFNPGIKGILFTLPSKHHISPEQLVKAQELLVHKTSNSVIYIEDRRTKPRTQ